MTQASLFDPPETAAEPVDRDPLHAVWLAYGRPHPDLPVTVAGQCCRCGTVGMGCAATGSKGAVSGGFTDWDRLTWRELGTNFCVPCSWGWRTRELRWYPHVVTGGWAGRAAPADVAGLLSRPLDAGEVVSVPVSMQKHLLPFARPGEVATDNTSLPWNQAEADRFATYRWLLGLGFNTAAVAEPVPRFTVLAKLPVADRAEVVGRWAELDPWREFPPHLEVAARATRKPKQKGSDGDA